ncbi:phytanoyl-CoA dioxygenase family protein [Sorangium sp. So ce1389]|uniref:phytanoyl-CoA dioxygenase family protein n=1 Tax=Sorangium sp. So ce1389 TaxID=3133336 RepID=UPI003F6178E2
MRAFESRTEDLAASLATLGYAWIRGLAAEPGLTALRAACERGVAEGLFARRRVGVYDARAALSALPDLAAWARAAADLPDVERLLGGPARLVKLGYYDKHLACNWSLPWHQDTSVAVREPRDADGFGPWFHKDGLHYAGAPAAVLDAILVVRLHLDACDEASGAMELVPGSHRSGKLESTAIEALASAAPSYICAAAAGDALISRPLIVHRSRESGAAEHRRVIHIEFAAAELPGGLSWWTPYRDVR